MAQQESSGSGSNYAPAIPIALGRVLGMWVFGASLRTPRVVWEVGFFALALTIQLGIDLWVWVRTWQMGLDSWIQAMFLGAAFATLIMTYDRSVGVMDTKNGAGLWKGLIIRVSILLALSAVTAVPTELVVFHPEIDRRIGDHEKVSTDRIRQAAVSRDTAIWNQRIARALQEASGDHAQATGSRAQQRLQLVETQRDRRRTLTAALATARENATREAGGRGQSGRGAGAGEVYDALVLHIPAAQAALDAFELQATEQLATFDNDTLTQTGTTTTNGRGAVTALERERDAHLAGVMRMDPDSLAVMYGGKWREPRGFLARYRVLDELRREDATTNAITWAVRLVMMAVGLLILGLKLTQSKETKEYYSLASQAAAGHPDAILVVQNMGFQDLQAHGADPEVVRLTEAYYATCRQCTTSLLAFDGKVHENAQAFEQSMKRRLRYDTVKSLLRESWRTEVLPRIHAVGEKAQKLRLRGAPVPAWPAELNDSQDPRDPKFQPWNISREDLTREYGWIDPQPELDRLDWARRRVLMLRQQLSKALAMTDAHAARLTADKKSVEEVRKLRLTHWTGTHEPLLTELDACERELEDGGMVVPEWPRHFPDPRIRLNQKIAQLQAEQARGEEGELANAEEVARARTVYPDANATAEGRASKPVLAIVPTE